MREHTELKILFEKYIDRTINKDELSQLKTYLDVEANEDQVDALFQEYFSAPLKQDADLEVKSELVEKRAWSRVQQHMERTGRFHFVRRYWSAIGVAATLLLALSVSFFFMKKNTPVGDKGSREVYTSNVKPGTNRATLRAANGAVYNLDGDKEEIIVDKTVIRYKNGKVLADRDSDQMVTLSTPRGGQYRVTLSDGTKVWLNAASSLSYPTNFKGNERLVALKGEAYFEVTHNARQPFIVATDGQRVKVLGTSFNVNSYKDEQKTVTTLLNGRVELSKAGSFSAERLYPGEQAIFNKGGFEVTKVDPMLYVAWKNGEFRFKATPLVEALRQIERWYDLDIDYTGIPGDIQIHASIDRSKELPTVLHALEKISDLKFKVKGRSVKLMH